MENNIERHLRELSVSDDSVYGHFTEIMDVPPDVEGNPSRRIIRNYKMTCDDKPQDNLSNSMKKLRKIALESAEFEVSNKTLPDWNVSKIKISGDVILHQSRVVMTLAKTVNRTGKVIPIVVPEITMYGNSEFAKADEMTKIIEDIIEEYWAYLNGDYTPNQISIFPKKRIALAQVVEE